MKRLNNGGVTTASGFTAAGVHSGIKAEADARDLALVYSAAPATATAVYTANKVQAAPIQIDKEHLGDSSAHAVILNSGNANACTGERGLENGRLMCQLTAAALGLDDTDVLVCSTGVIGLQLPMDVVERAIPSVVESLSPDGGGAAAEAIMTTDTVPKSFAVEIELDGTPVRVGGMAKGAGMIAPNMATMLSVITTDAAFEAPLLQKMLRRAVQRSFNCVTVDGDMSTNDTVIVLANGESGARKIERADDPRSELFYEGLEEVCSQLARMIARDGEGATKLVAIDVRGAKTESDARQVGLAIANSNLVKTAVFGCDPNWGRILCAIGYSGIDVEPAEIAVSVCGTPIYANGSGTDFEEETLVAAMRREEIPIDVDLGQGGESAAIFTCDLTYDYVRINAEYTT